MGGFRLLPPAVNAFYKTTFKTANNPDEDMQVERQFIYDNPICFGEESLFSRVDEIRVRKTTDSARIHVRFTLTNGNNEEQELVLQRREGKWKSLILSARTAAAYLSRLRQNRRQIKTMS